MVIDIASKGGYAATIFTKRRIRASENTTSGHLSE
jgi:hypothetical protein